MRILLITQYIYPETFKSSDMAFELTNRGHKIDVLTGIPNYPEGIYFKGYGLFKNRFEIKDGVKFFRCFQTPRKFLPGFFGLFLNYLTFLISSIFWVIFYFSWSKKYDAIICHEPSPITQIIPAIILGKLRKIPVYSWIMDIWPDSMTCHLRSPRIQKFIFKPLNILTNWIYKNSKYILITSPGFSEFINRDVDYSNKIIYFPNWSDDILAQPIMKCDNLPKGYNIMMAGNIASGVGIPAIISLLEECREIKNLNFIFVGGGSGLDEMVQITKAKRLTNSHFVGRQPFEMMHTYYDKADAMLLSLAKIDQPFLQATIPARLQSYMSAGKPILAMIDGGAAKMIIDNDLGYCVHAGDFKSLANYITNNLLSNIETFKLKGNNSRNLYEKEFTKQKCIDNLEKIISVK